MARPGRHRRLKDVSMLAQLQALSLCSLPSAHNDWWSASPLGEPQGKGHWQEWTSLTEHTTKVGNEGRKELRKKPEQSFLQASGILDSEAGMLPLPFHEGVEGIRRPKVVLVSRAYWKRKRSVTCNWVGWEGAHHLCCLLG